MIHNFLYETKVTGVTKLLKAHVKIRSFSMGTVNMSSRNILLVTKLAYNGRLTGVYIIALYLSSFNFHKLLLSTNEELYLQKQQLVGTLQKQVLLISTNISAVL